MSHGRGTDAFELWYWRRLLRAPWTARRSNQSILKEISPEYSLEGLLLKLKRQYVDHLMQRINSLEKTLMLRKIGGRRRRGRQRTRSKWHHRLDGQEFVQAPPELLMDREICCADVRGVAKIRTRLSDWTEWGEGLEEGTATHSSFLVWRIPWTEEPGGLQSSAS